MKCTRAIFAVVLLLTGAGWTTAQNAPARVPYDGADTPGAPKPIHIDGDCRVLPGVEGVRTKKTKPYHDDAICALEGMHESSHWEEKVEDNRLNRWFVRVKERTFAVQDISDDPVLYIVQFEIPKNWIIDSDPQPWQTVSQTAYFRVYVNPGETVRLHVGVRRQWPQGSKPI